MRLYRYIYILFLLTLHTGCKNHEFSDNITNRSPYFSAIVGDNDNNIFRNVNFGLKQDVVKKAETSKLFDFAPDHMFYEVTFPDDSSQFQEYADIEYYFNENDILDIMVARIYVNDSVQQSQLYNNLQQYYHAKLGSSAIDKFNGEFWKGQFTQGKSKPMDYYVFMEPLPKEFGISLEFKLQNSN